jgi:putative ABC transport system permease protein
MNWLPSHRDREVEEEIRFHLEMETEKNRRNGMTDDEARRAAQRAFGRVHRVREDIRDLRRTRAVELFVRDVAYGWRTLRRAPAYAITTILTLAIAVGVAAAMLTFVHSALLQPLPYRDADRIVALWETNRATGETQLAISPANFLDWEARSTAFESMALSGEHGFDVRRGDRVIAVAAGRVSQNYFRTLGVTPIAGRFFDPIDYAQGAPLRVVLAHRFWIEAFHGDRTLVGRTIEIDGKPAVVLGVVPDEIDHAAHYDVYAPLVLYPGEKTSRTGHWMYATARLRDGVSIAQAEADLRRVAQLVAAEHPQTNEALSVRAVPLREAILGKTRRLLIALAGGSVCLLLLACANIAALALARGAARRRELAIRMSLGASTGRIVRQLATEAAMLNAIAAVLACGIAVFVIRAIAANAPEELRRIDDVSAGGWTLAALAVLAIVSTLLSGALPALRLARSGPADDLESSRRDSGLTRNEARLQGVLVVTQIALALLLLSGAGLLSRSLQRLTSNDLGFDPDNVATIQMYLYDLHPNPAERLAFIRSSLAQMRALPAVEAVGATSALPFGPATEARDDFEIIGRPRRPGESLTIQTTAVTPGYFETMRIPLLAGRVLSESDHATSQRVAVVNEAAARRYWNGSPIGSKIRVGIMSAPREWLIVGVIADVRDSDYAQEARPEIYVPVAQGGPRVGGLNYVVRTAQAPRATLDAMQRTIWQLTPSQSITEAELMTELVGRSIQTRRFALLMISGFGLVALLLSSTGLFGLLSYIAARRRSEVGVRIALGATPVAIERLFVRRGLVLSAIGIAAGFVLSAAFSRVLESFLYETSTFDPVAMIGVTSTTALVAFVASWIPARRIAALDPNSVLRSA